MLSRELKAMELNNLVKRTEQADSPTAVEYGSTPYCRSFAPIILEMIKWGKQHRKELQKNSRP
jgi:DNA-binding HxlR family transcriptional regulator